MSQAPVRRGSAGIAAMINSMNTSSPPIPSHLPSVQEEEPSVPTSVKTQGGTGAGASQAALKPVTSIFERVDETLPPPVAPSNSNSNNNVYSKPATPASSASPASGSGASNRCPVCDKSVFKVEEVIASGRTWHKSCFRCSAFSKDGCNKVLTRDKYLDHEKEPYCNACYDKLWKPKGYGYAGAFSATTATSTPSSSSSTATSSSYGARNSDLSSDEINAVRELTISSSPAESSTSSTLFNQSANRRPVGTSQNLAASIIGTTPSVSSSTPTTAAPPSAAQSYSAAPLEKHFKRPSMADAKAIHTELGVAAPDASANLTKKCPVCDKSVFKVEEVIASGQTWHKSCFRCSAFSKDGCNKVLTRDKYLDHEKEPYCNACYDKLWKPKGYGYAGAFSASVADTNASTNTSAATTSVSAEKPEAARRTTYTGSVFAGTNAVVSTPAPVTSSTTSSSSSTSFVNKTADKMKAVASTGPTCTICTKTVYKMEEVVALGRTYHKTCFTCGGRAGDGCKRTLKLDGYLEHDNQPYCNSCYSKLWKPKGYGTGASLNTDYGTSGAEEVSAAKSALSSSTTPAGPTFVFEDVAPTKAPPPAPIPARASNTNTPILVLAPKKTVVANPLGFSDAELAVLQQPGENEIGAGRGSLSGVDRRPSLKDIGFTYSGGSDEVDDGEW